MCRNSRCGTPAKVSCNANSLVADENTPDVMLWFIKAYDYNQKRVLNVSFCTRYMGPPFFFRAIPTYGVLPYSMIVPRVNRLAPKKVHLNNALYMHGVSCMYFTSNPHLAKS